MGEEPLIYSQILFLDIKDVYSFGWDGVMIESCAVLTAIPKHSNFTIANENRLAGRMMMTREGDRLDFFKMYISMKKWAQS